MAAILTHLKRTTSLTVKHLLHHRSGIHNFTDDEDYLTWNTKAKTEKEMVEIIAKAGSDFEPDSRAVYSNSNYVLLTYILEKSFKKPYADLLTEYITRPTGLENTYLGRKINTKNGECNSYLFHQVRAGLYLHQAGIVLEFNPADKVMILKQGGGQFTFTKE